MSVVRIVRHSAFAWGSAAVLATALGFIAWNGITGQWADMLVWCAIAAVCAGVVFFRKMLPPFHGFLLALAATVNGAGYTLTLWHEQTSFDEAVHAFTTFAGMAAIGWMLLRSGKFSSSRGKLFWTVIGLGIILGLLWEGVEMIIGISGSPRDTLIDMIMDTLGATAAASLSCRIASFARKV